MRPLNLPDTIFTERLVLQRLRYEDAEEIFYTYASKPEATRFMSWATHRVIADTRAFLRYAVDAWHMGMDYSFAIRLKETNRLIGSFGVINENGRLQFGYILSPTQWGNGYATEVCRKMMSVLKTQDGVYRIGTYVDVDNAASVRVLTKSGLVEEARLARWMRFPNQNDTPKDCILFTLPVSGSE
ncbi:MAG TPA: GNAT family protein [Ohtaekwangia sp.]|nr:GNAT family protein [Ohtaekwangia sp.]